MKKITEIIYNWFASSENGEECSVATVGKPFDKSVVSRIEEHPAQGDGDKWYWDVMLEDGRTFRVFNANTVEYSKD